MKKKYASSGAKEIQIKSVIQAILVYAMCIFKFPASLCDELSQIIRNFWWGDEENRKRTHWLAWDNMTKPKSEGGMGFRDLRLFNQALLAKQAWRLLVFPDSLCAKVMKAKYYPHGHLIDTVFPQATSLTWQGIMHGLELLKKGIIWRVVDGTSINIWRDNCIPREAGLKISAKKNRTRIKWVSELFMSGSRSWDVNLIRHLFYPYDAEEILKLRTLNLGEGDLIAWHHEKSGLFSVKSACRLALILKQSQGEVGNSSSAMNGERRLWNIIWKANVPQKIRIFAWKAASNSLAVQVNRVKHHQTIQGTCSICGIEDECIFHALVNCPKARAFRMALKEVWNLPAEEILKYSGPDWFLILLDQLSSHMREQTIFMFWRAWHLRNDLIFGKGKESITASVSFVQNYWASFSSCHANMQVAAGNKGKQVMEEPQVTTNMESNVISWKLPTLGFFKINVDASFVEAIKASSVGVVVRDHHGQVIISSWDYIGVCHSVEEAELRATLSGLYIGTTLDKSIILETDCSFVASVFGKECVDRSTLADLKKEALNVSKLMVGIKIFKINRTANMVAHEIAKFSFDSRSDGILFNSVPPCVANFIMNDCMNVLN